MSYKSIKRDFKKLESFNVPTKRAAYSDRTAWLMAILSEIAYVKFDETTNEAILKYAEMICEITNQKDYSSETIRTTLTKFSEELELLSKNGDGKEIKKDDTILNKLLNLGGFKLANGSPIENTDTDTQAFVAIPLENEESKMSQNEEDLKFAVVCFRGSQQIRDWYTNLKFNKVPIKDPLDEDSYVGKMHEGFHEAYKSVESDINEQLKDIKHLPIYITGHSLGGALAVIATWYQNKQELAACYTFGAPRVGDSELKGRFRTPIYRIVNGADPVPTIPSAGKSWIILKAFFRTLSIINVFKSLIELTINKQRYRHYGYTKYITYSILKGKTGIYNEIDNLDRFSRLLINFFTPKVVTAVDNNPIIEKLDRILKFHDIIEYRKKLRSIAIDRNPPPKKKNKDVSSSETDK